MEFLIGTLLAPNIASIILNGVVDKAKEKNIESELNQIIANLNSNYLNSEVDCGIFERFLTKNEEKIKNYLLSIDLQNSKVDYIFIDEISNLAIEFINSERNKINYLALKDDSIVKKYFTELFSDINNLIYKQLDIKDKFTINTINRNCDNNHNALMNQNNALMNQNEEIIEMLNALKEDMNKKNSNLLDDKLKNKLKYNNINFREESNIKINSTNHDVKGVFLVKYNEFLSKFNNLSEVLEYSYRTQKTIVLEPVEFKLLIDGNIIQEFKYENKDQSELVALEFVSEGEIDLAIGYFANNSLQNGQLSELKIIPPMACFDKKIRLENEDFETILDNINLRIDDISTVNNISTTIMSNKQQQNAQVYVTFKVSLDTDENIISNNANFEIVNPSSALSIMYWINTMIKINNSKSLTARLVDGNIFLFEGKFDFNESIDLSVEKKLIQKLLYIENRLDIKFKISPELIVNYAEEINSLKNILDTGISNINISSMSIKGKEIKSKCNIPTDSKLLFHFISNDKFELFGEKIDLGEHLIVLTKTCISKYDDKDLILDICSDSKNIVVYKNFYNGEFKFESILENENLGKIS